MVLSTRYILAKKNLRCAQDDNFFIVVTQLLTPFAQKKPPQFGKAF